MDTVIIYPYGVFVKTENFGNVVKFVKINGYVSWGNLFHALWLW